MAYNILVADDDILSRKVMSSVLTNDNNAVYSVFEARNATEALDMVSHGHIDLVLLDWQMPDMSGLEAMKHIKRMDRMIPVIIVTGLIDSKDLSYALDLGANDYIKKPIDKVEFRARIRSALMLRDSMLEIQNKNKKIETQIYDLNKMSLIVKQTDNSVIIFSPDGEVEWANEGFHKMYGYTLSEFVELYGTNISNISSNPGISVYIAEMLENKRTVEYVTNCKVKSGNNKWIQTALTPIFDGNRIEKIIAIESDITKQKLYELQLIKQNEESLRLMDDLRRANKTIDLERQKTRGILLNMMPEEMVEELMGVGYAGPRSFSAATIMFTDFKGFSKSCEHLTPKQIVDSLDFFFSTFDDIVDRHVIEKIKTIGDAYMCVGGLPIRNRTHPIDVVMAALEIKHFMATYLRDNPKLGLPDWQLRIGIHTGPLVAGMVGKKKLAYDIWGDSVNVASRMESAGEPGLINISSSTYERVKEYFECTPRGSISIKNHQNVDMYFLDRFKPEFSKDRDGCFPNDKFKAILNTI